MKGSGQWGYSTAATANGKNLSTITFPIAINTVMVVCQKGNKTATTIGDYGTSGWYNRQELCINVTTTTFQTPIFNATGYGGCQWHAIGY